MTQKDISEERLIFLAWLLVDEANRCRTSVDATVDFTLQARTNRHPALRGTTLATRTFALHDGTARPIEFVSQDFELFFEFQLLDAILSSAKHGTWNPSST